MAIVVHSMNRASLIGGTLSAFKSAGLRVVIACPSPQVADYLKHWPMMAVRAVPERIKGLPATQQFIVDTIKSDKLIMMDDDLLFYHRVPNTKKRNRCEPHELRGMLSALLGGLNLCVHAGIMVNKDIGLQDIYPPLSDCGPMRSVLAYRVMDIRRMGIRFDRVVSKSDYDVTLQLYRRGLRAMIFRNYGHEQCGGPDLPGGVTEYRDEDMHAKASEALHALHPDFVTVVEKERKGWSFKRKDVRVQWRKALTHGLEHWGF